MAVDVRSPVGYHPAKTPHWFPSQTPPLWFRLQLTLSSHSKCSQWWSHWRDLRGWLGVKSQFSFSVSTAHTISLIFSSRAKLEPEFQQLGPTSRTRTASELTLWVPSARTHTLPASPPPLTHFRHTGSHCVHCQHSVLKCCCAVRKWFLNTTMHLSLKCMGMCVT